MNSGPRSAPHPGGIKSERWARSDRNGWAASPESAAKFQKFNTSPFVLMFYSKKQGYSRVSEIEGDIIPAKVFSSMETSAGRMVEEVVLPVYGWEVVPSQMHSIESLLDGRKSTAQDFLGVTLKSGPRCLNDEMAQNIGRDVATHVPTWAANHGAQKVDFTYGVLYGTKRLSNKKDWHILRSIAEVLPADAVVHTSHSGQWSIGYQRGGLDVTATVRIGIDWWTYLGGATAWIEVCLALIRACVVVAPPRTDVPQYAISDLAEILDTSGLPAGFNVAIVQESQIEWLLFLARHFCDGFQD
ncbi:PmeII family type II restriction endonuclease [Novosphingobium sp. FKTRR1]|uniref:PmeII family type II restriction endonuclease n=1 Tax=Novosphingobium sp. FKTRR1 TaxID=2879118 RepID=UPI001CF0C2FC